MGKMDSALLAITARLAERGAQVTAIDPPRLAKQPTLPAMVPPPLAMMLNLLQRRRNPLKRAKIGYNETSTSCHGNENLCNGGKLAATAPTLPAKRPQKSAITLFRPKTAFFSYT
jgi:hypothetical protein